MYDSNHRLKWVKNLATIATKNCYWQNLQPSNGQLACLWILLVFCILAGEATKPRPRLHSASDAADSERPISARTLFIPRSCRLLLNANIVAVRWQTECPQQSDKERQSDTRGHVEFLTNLLVRCLFNLSLCFPWSRQIITFLFFFFFLSLKHKQVRSKSWKIYQKLKEDKKTKKKPKKLITLLTAVDVGVSSLDLYLF